MSSLDFIVLYNLRSSASSEHIQYSIFSIISLINTRNNRGPRCEPCGDPLLANYVSDLNSMILTANGPE